jgi:Zn-dependent protease
MDPQTVVHYLTFIPAFVLAIACHECAHAATALAFGDPTAARQGRVSLNPLVHLDLVGTLALFLVGVGWAKPTPVDPRYFRHRWAELCVSAAGPVSNLLLALVAGVLLRIPILFQAFHVIGADVWVGVGLQMVVDTNLLFAFFNFLPLPPLDGSHVLEQLLPARPAAHLRQFYQSVGVWLLIGVIISERLLPISLLSSLVYQPTRFLSALLIPS